MVSGVGHLFDFLECVKCNFFWEKVMCGKKIENAMGTQPT